MVNGWLVGAIGQLVDGQWLAGGRPWEPAFERTGAAGPKQSKPHCIHDKSKVR